jgi:iron complex outermembrane receptor protein
MRKLNVPNVRTNRGNKIIMRSATFLVSTALVLSFPAIASAQSSGTGDKTESASKEGLGEIIVTAQRRPENSQRAAVPLAVISGATLAAANVTQAGALNELAPSLQVEPNSTGNIIFMRGVGNFTVVSASDPAVAFNVDGVYIGRPSSTTGMFFDLERIEVLKGPQGILYGRNATGGAINILPVQPRLGELSGFVNATYGNYNTINAEGAINVPLGEHSALRFSATTSNHDGYLADGTSDEKSVALRAQIKAELTPDLTVRLSGDYAHNGGAGYSVNYFGKYVRNNAVAIGAGPVPGTNYYTFVPANLPESEGVSSPISQAYRQTVVFGAFGQLLGPLTPYPSQNNDFYGVNAEITWKTGAGTLTVIPAWRNAKIDSIATAGAFVYKNKETAEQFSLEARFSGNRIGIFDYTLGAYFFKETIHSDTALTITNTASWLKPNYDTKSYAGFGRLVANLTDQLRVVAGVRYTKDDKAFAYSAVGAVINCLARNGFGAPACPTAPQIQLVAGPSLLPFPFPAAGGAPIPVFTTPGPPNYVIIRTDPVFNRTKSSSRVTWRGAVEFDVAPQSMLYASVETGYRSGGFSAAAGFEDFAPETITAYTIGMKNRFLDNRVQLNLEGFIWDYKDQQVNHVGLDRNGFPANYTQNVGSSKIKGIEVDGRFLVTPNTLVSADVQYLDAVQKDFVFLAGPGNPPVTGCNVSFNAANASPYTIDCSGFASYNSPKWTINLAAQQTIPVGDYRLVIGADTQFKGMRNIGFAYLPEQTLGGVWSSSAHIQFGPADDRWFISAYVRNIEDNRTPNYSSTHPSANILIAGTTTPRTFGVRAGIKF